MCIAAPFQIVEINAERTKATGVLSGNRLEIDIRLISPAVGDYVLVHAGCALEIVNKEAAEEISDILTDLEAAFKNED